MCFCQHETFIGAISQLLVQNNKAFFRSFHFRVYQWLKLDLEIKDGKIVGVVAEVERLSKQVSVGSSGSFDLWWCKV